MISYRTLIVIDRRGGKSTIRLRVKWCNSKYVASFNLHIRIDEDKFDLATMRAKRNTFHFGVSSTDINRTIQRYEDTIGEFFAECSRKDKTPTADQLKRAVEKGDEAQKTPAEMFEEFIKERERKSRLSYNTLGKYLQLLKMLKELRLPDVQDWNESVYRKFYEYHSERKLKSSTFKLRIVAIKMFCKWANKTYGFKIHADDFDYKEDKGDNPIIYLTPDEMERLKNVITVTEIEKNALDMFIFCAYTSLRFSDMQSLTPSDIYDDKIHLLIRKTAKAVTIELNKHSREIYQRHKEGEGSGKFLFPRINHSVYNDTIKRLCKRAEINEMVRRNAYGINGRSTTSTEKWKLVASHTARKTFVVNALRLGIPAEIIMKWTGHSNFQTMKPYIEIVDELKSKNMEKFDL